MSKGIRVNLLAKELGVESKKIIERCHTEGVGDKVTNHMSLLSLGLAESVRGWFQNSAVEAAATAVSSGEAVEVLTKAKTSRSRTARRKVADEDGAGSGGGDSATATLDEAEPGTEHSAAAAAGDEEHPRKHRAKSTRHGEANHGEVDRVETGTDEVHPTPAVATPPENETPAVAVGEIVGKSVAEVEPLLTPSDTVLPEAVVVAETPAHTKPAGEHPVHHAGGKVAKVADESIHAKADKPEVVPETAAVEPGVVASGTAGGSVVAPGTGHKEGARKGVAKPLHSGSSHGTAHKHAGASAAAGKPATGAAPSMRPTITLTNRPNQPERKVVKPVMHVPKPAVIQGPTVIREEAPENLPAPRPRSRLGTNQPGAASETGVTQSRHRTGGGVIRVEDDEEEKKKAAKKNAASLSSRRRGMDGRRGEALEKLREFTEADLIARRDAINAAAATRAGVDRHLKQVSGRGQHAIAKSTVQKGDPVEIEEPITVRSLAATLGVKSSELITKLMRQGVFVTVNQSLDIAAAETMALDYGLELTIKRQATKEEEFLATFDDRPRLPEHLVPRPPVVTILGHVDHGKTSLLDKIRNAHVAAGEAGGITQHTAAWMVSIGEGDAKKSVTFIDTPGHQAFTSMRARGANMTDIVVLVVSAAEGVQPQTIESINHAKAAGVPIVVAMNKIDRPDCNPDMVMGQLAANGLNPVEWGGDTEVVRTSAVTGVGIKDLIEILDLQAEILELKTDPTAPVRGSVIESRVDEGLGAVATVLIQDGTLRPGDVVISGSGFGRVRTMLNDRGEQIMEATASMPIIISGFDQLPDAGDKVFQTETLDQAREIGEDRAVASRHTHLSSQGKVTLDNLFESMKANDVKTINLIIKGDVQGSVETLTKTVTEQNTAEVKVRVIHSGVGGINESDVELADASKAVIIGFHVIPDEAARAMAEQRRVEVRLYRVIYEIFDDLKKALSGMLEPEIREKLHGHIEIRKVYKFSKVGNIAGCFVTDGHVQRGSKIRLTRNGVVITEDLTIETLKRIKEDVKEVKAGLECGLKLAGYDDIKEGDVLVAYVKETIQRTL